jgi:hypothetical protein
MVSLPDSSSSSSSSSSEEEEEEESAPADNRRRAARNVTYNMKEYDEMIKKALADDEVSISFNFIVFVIVVYCK